MSAPLHDEALHDEALHDEALHDEAFLARAIDQSLGNAVADLVIKGGRVFNLVTGALEARDVAVCGDRIVGVESGYRGVREIDAAGKIVVPGFIDTHCHVESSLLTPAEFDRCVLPHGVTTAIWDPHEIANVLGPEGMRYALAADTKSETTRAYGVSALPTLVIIDKRGTDITRREAISVRFVPMIRGVR